MAANQLNEQLLADLNFSRQKFNQLNTQVIQAQQEESEVARQIQNLALDFNQVQDDQASIKLQLIDRNAQIQKQSKQLIHLQQEVQQLRSFNAFGKRILGAQLPIDESLEQYKLNLTSSLANNGILSQYQSIRLKTVVGSISETQRSTIYQDTQTLKTYLIEYSKKGENVTTTAEIIDDIEGSESGSVDENHFCEVNLLSNGWLHVPALDIEPTTCIKTLIAELSPHRLLIQLTTNNEVEVKMWRIAYPKATIQIRPEEASEGNNGFYSAFLIPRV